MVANFPKPGEIKCQDIETGCHNSFSQFFNLISHLVSYIHLNNFSAVLGEEEIENAGREKEQEQNK